MTGYGITNMSKNIVICSVLFACALIAIPQAFAETHEIQVSDSGFSQTTLTINSGDVVKFSNTHVAWDSLEPHCISDPFAQPYTEMSCWIIDGSDPTRSYELSESQTFYDRYFPEFTPIVVTVNGQSTSTTYDVETEDIDSAPEYTGTINESVLQTNLAEVTLDLTNALETIGTLQSQLVQKDSQIVSLQNEIVDLENQVVDVTPYTNQITSLTAERDQWKQTAESWYGIALEQVRIMVEVLGL
tara:strand:- start:223 stop:954 length:732 start_codon:yes stop_codon:yes gene_type:complete